MEITRKTMTKAGNDANLAKLGINTNVKKNKDRAPEHMMRSCEPYKPRKKVENEAPPRSNNSWTEELYDGADLKPFEGRPGAMTAYSLPSKGMWS